MRKLNEIQEAFSGDRFATNRAEIRIVSAQDGAAVCEMPITTEHLNARGTVMGGAIFTLADFTAAVAVTYPKGVFSCLLNIRLPKALYTCPLH